MAGGTGQFKMKTPSVAMKLKDDLLRMASIKQMFAIKEGKEDKENEAKRFVQVFEREWKIKLGVTTTAVTTERRFNKKPSLPNPDDIRKLSVYIKPSSLKYLRKKLGS